MPKVASKLVHAKKSQRQPAARKPGARVGRPSKRTPVEEILQDEPFETEESHVLNDADDEDAEAELDAELEIELAEQADVKATGEDDQIDDPIRIYLMQMGEIPLLDRQEELLAAQQIKRARRRFRNTMLATDYVLQAAIAMLESIRDGRARLDRTIEVSVINLREKRRL